MIRRNTWVLLGLLAVALALVWAVPQWQASHPGATPTQASYRQPVFGSAQVKITQVEVTNKDGKGLTLKIAGDGQWGSEAKNGAPKVTPDKIGPAVTSLAGANIVNVLPTPPPLDVIGLQSPMYTILVVIDEGPTRILQVGSQTPTGNGYYVQVDGGSPEVVEKNPLDTLLNLLTASTEPTGTPGTGTPGETPSVPVATPIQVFMTPTP